MKISILTVEGAKQIILTPESDHDREALSYISPEDKLKVVSKRGHFMGNELQHVGIYPDLNKAGYYRMFSDQESVMFVIEPEEDSEGGVNHD